jgi:hypothetical protein
LIFIIFETFKKCGSPLCKIIYISTNFNKITKKYNLKYFNIYLGFNRKIAFNLIIVRINPSFVVVFQSYYIVEESDSKLGISLRIEFEQY